MGGAEAGIVLRAIAEVLDRGGDSFSFALALTLGTSVHFTHIQAFLPFLINRVTPR